MKLCDLISFMSRGHIFSAPADTGEIYEE